ncbi:MAG: hypothetical protein RLZZ396_759, partial [Planctomycetota bacterium]
LRGLQGGEEDQNQQTRNESSWTDEELGVRHGEVDSKDSSKETGRVTIISL